MNDLDAIEARLEAATPGPWTAQNLEADHGHQGIFWVSNLSEGSKTIAEVDANDDGVEVVWSFKDAEFIAHARTDIPFLLDLVRKQEDLLTAVLDLANVSGRRGWRINADDIRKTLGAEL